MAGAEMTTEPPRCGLALDHEHGRSLRVRYGDTELLRYVYRTWEPQVESPRPYLHPVRTLGGDEITAYRPHDHVWHKGVAWSLPFVGDDNFWGGGSYLHGSGYVQLPNNGGMWHRRFVAITADVDRVDIAHELDWITEPGERRIDERRALAVTLTGDAWVLAFSTAMTNVSADPIALGSPTTRGRPAAGYGGLFWRGPRAFTGGRVFTPAGGAAGGDELMGTRHPWLAFTGRHDGTGRRSTLLFVDAPANPGHPTRWFVRSTEFAAVCPAPFFSAEVTVAPGDTLRLRYAMVVADGEPGPAELAALAAAGLDAMRAADR
ncbi:MAG: hypothetical protein QOE03_3046 [Micromonosporaceae bacterium]|nr:hypothetical protein [Micromonosporaceae bacterium]